VSSSAAALIGTLGREAAASMMCFMNELRCHSADASSSVLAGAELMKSIMSGS
jgi:hypothetical protein